mgnify:CR=1 FL=1
MTNNYSTITELPGTLVADKQLRCAHLRYIIAKKYCDGGNILELGYGGGGGKGSNHYQVMQHCHRLRY